MILGSRFPEVTLRRLVEKVFFNGETHPPRFDRLEIDEIRIIAGYLRRREGEGKAVEVRGEDTVESLLARVREALV